jgi:hypothetical protein
MRIAGLCAATLLCGCTNVTQMQQRYQAGDHSQLPRLLEIASRPDYPYSTRRKAARSLGEIGDPQAVPVLTQLLYDYDQRLTLRQEALGALGRIGDTSAVPAIGRMLDLQLNEASGELRLAAMQALGQLGGQEAAGILVNAVRYYDVLALRQEQATYRGIFSGQEMDPREYGPPGADSTGAQRPDAPRMGMFGDETETGAVNMFGLPMDNPLDDRDFAAEEQGLARAALVRIGPAALPVIERFLLETQTTPSLRRDLGGIAVEIRAATGPDSAAVAAPDPAVAPPAR